jgi:mono/diheme cytochrome c family protein
MKALLAIALVIGVAGIALAQERKVDFKPGPGAQQVQASCGTCHSLDYIVINSPFLDRAGWDASVTKMIKVFGAPINDTDAKAIAEYLAANYGKQ